MATGPEHYTEAERMRAAADEWMDADTGWKANLSAQERINQRLADLADAQVHATLALAAATAMGAYDTLPEQDCEAWDAVAGVQEDDAQDGADDELALWRRHDVSDVMQTVEIHDAPMPGSDPAVES